MNAFTATNWDQLTGFSRLSFRRDVRIEVDGRKLLSGSRLLRGHGGLELQQFVL